MIGNIWKYLIMAVKYESRRNLKFDILYDTAI